MQAHPAPIPEEVVGISCNLCPFLIVVYPYSIFGQSAGHGRVCRYLIRKACPAVRIILEIHQIHPAAADRIQNGIPIPFVNPAVSGGIPCQHCPRMDILFCIGTAFQFHKSCIHHGCFNISVHADILCVVLIPARSNGQRILAFFQPFKQQGLFIRPCSQTGFLRTASPCVSFHSHCEFRPGPVQQCVSQDNFNAALGCRIHTDIVPVRNILTGFGKFVFSFLRYRFFGYRLICIRRSILRPVLLR